ncbi:hypothetical protein [Sorangium sp. So ce1389]|uniref:hypothetical protein n=1 Tax=Sorangium sp. So ce1389 TaxID=3133336 RepID=UPI003F6169B3
MSNLNHGSAEEESDRKAAAERRVTPVTFADQELAPGESRKQVLELDSITRAKLNHGLSIGGKRTEIDRVELVAFSRPEPQENKAAAAQALSGRATAGFHVTAFESGSQICAYQATWTWDYVERTIATIVGKDQKFWGPWSFDRDIVVWESYNPPTWEYQVQRDGIFKDWFRSVTVSIKGVLRSNGRSAFWGWVT